ncbi:MAG: helix-turn-helix domain-containing protein [Gammaproteobacteria bacterium]|nr:helix-turn-helix domain-containing protein [Gammaproteobacteria bacterium]
MKRVVAALYPRTLATSLALPMDVLRAASQAASAQHRGQPQLEFLVAATSPQAVETVGGLSVQPDISLAEIGSCDMLLLPAMWRNPQPILRQQQPWLPVLQSLAEAGTSICSVGTASCFLAEAGLLDGQAAATHWNYFEEFQQRYPRVKLKRHHLITQSGNLYCAGSVNSIADLMIHIVEDWFGSRIARAVESQFSPEIRRPFRAHAYQSSDDALHQDELVLTAQQWLQDQYHESISLSELAARLDCSPRTLSRRFKAVTGQTPSQYLQKQRLAAATELLRATNLSVGEIAWQVGLHDVSYFTALFRKQRGQTPAKYRLSVRAKLFNPKL